MGVDTFYCIGNSSYYNDKYFLGTIVKGIITIMINDATVLKLVLMNCVSLITVQYWMLVKFHL